jgi:hypothetical protein
MKSEVVQPNDLVDVQSLEIRKNYGPKSGIHIVLDDEGVKVEMGLGQMSPKELNRLQAVAGPIIEQSPIQLNIEKPALEMWAATIVDEAFIQRSRNLVDVLGIWKKGEPRLNARVIVAKITRGMSMVVGAPFNASILEIFHSNTRACLYALLTGLFHEYRAYLESKKSSEEGVVEQFTQAMFDLGIDPSNHTEYVRGMNQSTGLFLWLSPEQNIGSLFADIEALLCNYDLYKKYQASLDEPDNSSLLLEGEDAKAYQMVVKAVTQMEGSKAFIKDENKGKREKEFGVLLYRVQSLLSYESNRHLWRSIRSILDHKLQPLEIEDSPDDV